MSNISYGKVDRTPDLMERLQRLQEGLLHTNSIRTYDANILTPEKNRFNFKL